MSKDMWFGTRGYETWVKAPAPGGDSSRVGYSSTLAFLNGGAAARASQAAHREYNWSWPKTTRENIREIVDFAEGVYDSGSGVNLIYFIDPMTADQNVLPQSWATPAQALADALPLINDYDPGAAVTPANDFRYPARGARYTVASGASVRTLYVPIPPGYTAWIGVHGATATGLVRVTPFQGAAAQSLIYPTVLPVTTSTRVNTPISGTGLELSLAPGASGTLYGNILQMLPNGKSPKPGTFISGQGHSGCQFAGQPSQSPYSTYFDSIGMSAKLIETGDWLF